MSADFGFYLMLLCCLSSVYGMVSAIAAAKLRHRRLYLSSKMALTSTLVMALTAAGIFWYLLFNRDYSVSYIMRNSSNDLPWWYTITSFWSALEGSHFLWTILMTVVASIAIWTHSRDNEHIMPYVSATLQGVMAWMYYLAITYSDPFARFFPAPPNGQGMNALLQNPYMAIHPPCLFTGYTCLSVPFAYAMAALFFGDVTEGWLKSIRRWTLVSWCFLTGAIFLGGHWAYEELGWSGYWAWDPVENSSFMPWILATCLLHSLLVQDKLGHLKRMSIILAAFAFIMTFFGTFITRSGVISSVHSFAESPIGPNYLIFIGILLFAFALAYGLRAHAILPSETDKVWGVTKESALVVTQFLLLTLGVIVFTGTIFPIVSEAITRQRISVQAPYFNAFAPYIGLGLMIAIAFGNLMHYQSSRVTGGKKILLYGLLVALPVSIPLMYFSGVFQTTHKFNLVAQIIGMYLAAWCMVCLTADFYVRLRQMRFSWRAMLGRNRGFVGAYIAHIGLVTALFGFLGNYRSLNREVSMKDGESIEFFGYQFTFTHMEIKEQANATLFQAPLKVTRDGKDLGLMIPARSRYPTKAELLHEVAVKGNLWHDLYIVLADFNKETGSQITLQLHLNPTVRMVWASCVLMVLGGLVCLSDKVRGNRSRDVVGASWQA